jgi:hypothetical protein
MPVKSRKKEIFASLQRLYLRIRRFCDPKNFGIDPPTPANTSLYFWRILVKCSQYINCNLGDGTGRGVEIINFCQSISHVLVDSFLAKCWTTTLFEKSRRRQLLGVDGVVGSGYFSQQRSYFTYMN